MSTSLWPPPARLTATALNAPDFDESASVSRPGPPPIASVAPPALAGRELVRTPSRQIAKRACPERMLAAVATTSRRASGGPLKATVKTTAAAPALCATLVATVGEISGARRTATRRASPMGSPLAAESRLTVRAAVLATYTVPLRPAMPCGRCPTGTTRTVRLAPARSTTATPSLAGSVAKRRPAGEIQTSPGLAGSAISEGLTLPDRSRTASPRRIGTYRRPLNESSVPCARDRPGSASRRSDGCPCAASARSSRRSRPRARHSSRRARPRRRWRRSPCPGARRRRPPDRPGRRASCRPPRPARRRRRRAASRPRAAPTPAPGRASARESALTPPALATTRRPPETASARGRTPSVATFSGASVFGFSRAMYPRGVTR